MCETIFSKKKGLIIKKRPVLVDPEDSEMLATSYPRAKHRMGLSSITASTSPDLVALSCEIEEEH
jgi:hypothetical protein